MIGQTGQNLTAGMYRRFGNIFGVVAAEKPYEEIVHI
jgi:hypothetical protein